MEVRAISKDTGISPRKMRLLVDMVKGKTVDEALNTLRFAPTPNARILAKTIKSAIANAEHNEGADVDELKITKVYVDQGPSYKRIRPRAKGRADRILKRTSHITVVVGDKK